MAGKKLDEPLMESLRDKKSGLMPIRFLGFRGADVVDTPAATRTGLFSSTDFAGESLEAVATTLLDTHMAGAQPEAVRTRVSAFLNTYFATKESFSMTDAEQKAAEDKAAADLAAKTAADSAAAKKAADDKAAADLAAKQAADKAAADLAAKNAGTNTAEIERNAALAENTRVREIDALCQLAGRPDLIAVFTAIEPVALSVADVKAKLFDESVKKNVGLGDGGNKDLGAGGADAKFKKEYADQKAQFADSGVSEADYVASRRVDEGLDKLSTAPPAAK